jgi:hypothetical protein
MIHTEAHIHDETHKGRKPLVLRMICSIFMLCTSSIFEHQLNVRLPPLFYKLQLFEITNSLVSLAPTRRKHQLPKCSSTNWMEEPTSYHTGTNLYNREQYFSLAPPYHPGFSGCNQMEDTIPCVQAPT